MLSIPITVTVEAPQVEAQLEALRRTIERLGEHAMADFDALIPVVTSLQQAITQAVAALQSDVRDQEQIDQLVTNLKAMQQQLAAAVPEAPAPTP